MAIPPYFKQQKLRTCSLACLRMALGYFDITVTEKELETKIEPDYGKNFKNLWNTTIAKLACEYGLDTTLDADWPLLKRDTLRKALDEYTTNPELFNIRQYENPTDKDRLPEPLPLAYREMFHAVKKGCKTNYESISEEVIKTNLSKGYLIQTSIKRNKLYPGHKATYHSLLLYKTLGDTVYFHDPAEGAAMSCTIKHLVSAAMDVGAYMVYQKKTT